MYAHCLFLNMRSYIYIVCNKILAVEYFGEVGKIILIYQNILV